MSQADQTVSSASNPHCQLHARNTAGCAACARAQAAFAPYQMAGKPEAASRSFQNGSSLIVSDTTLTGADLAKSSWLRSLLNPWSILCSARYFTFDHRPSIARANAGLQ